MVSEPNRDFGNRDTSLLKTRHCWNKNGISAIWSSLDNFILDLNGHSRKNSGSINSFLKDYKVFVLKGSKYNLEISNSAWSMSESHWISWRVKEGRQSDFVELLVPDGESPLSYGCFLMFPWVNRLGLSHLDPQKAGFSLIVPDYTDATGLPLHGYSVSSPRKLESATLDSLQFSISDPRLQTLFPGLKIRETVHLSEPSSRQHKLSLSISFSYTGSGTIEFALGYHPYFRLLGQRKDWICTFLSAKEWKLDERLLPEIGMDPLFLGEKMETGIRDWDNLFQTNQLEWKNETLKVGFRLVSREEKSDFQFPFLQIYSPAESNFMAVEPMSSPADSWAFPEFLIRMEPGETKTGGWSVEYFRF